MTSPAGSSKDQQARKPLRIEDYALIGDCETAALVGRDGSIDWLCWPHFSSAACFSKLLGGEDNGFWKLAPCDEVQHSERCYEDHTLILNATHKTSGGRVRVVDFMPPRSKHSFIIRMVHGLEGEVAMRSELVLRFGYGAAVPWVTSTQFGIRAVAGPDSVELHSPIEHRGHQMHTVAEFTIKAGQMIPFVLRYGTYGDYHENGMREALDVQAAYEHAKQFWCDWSAQCAYEGRYRELVERSLITLKALTFRPTGGIVAAPTTSLPEHIGGVRNWDYRFCWLRDTTFTLLALMNGGYYSEAREWMRWLFRTIAGSPDQVQIMYGIQGERALPEWEIKWLHGYEDSRPVRVGNAASEQFQLDIYGEVLDAMYWTCGKLGVEHSTNFGLIQVMMEHLDKIWDQPDQGIWEVRGGPRQFTYSKVMAWVAFDRAVKIARAGKLDAPFERWEGLRDQIHQQVCERAYSEKVKSFTQSYGDDQLDASVLLIPLVGFLPPEDPRVHNTVDAIERKLVQGGLVMRYDTSKTEDGLPQSEGKFLACSFWLVSNLMLIGREADALKLFDKLCGLANDVGLLSEEYDDSIGRMTGNFPQALSHISLLGAATTLTDHQGMHRRDAARPHQQQSKQSEAA